MNLLKAALYDPAVAVSKATSALLAMTAFDTTNLRLAITVPAHGMVRFRLRCVITGATTCPTILLGCLNGATVIGRVSPMAENGTANAATQGFVVDVEFTVTGLTPGAMNVDAAYGVEVVVAATNIKYGGPNDTTGANAWGGFVFEAWDPQPQTTTGQLSVDANGRVDVAKWLGSAVSALIAGRVDSNPGAIQANVITAASINAAAMNGKGDWNIGKTGYALSAAGVQAIWDALTSALTTVGSIGKLFVDNINATISSRMATFSLPANFSALSITAAGLVDITQAAADKVWSTATRALTDKVGFALSAAGVNAIWDQLVAGITTVNSIGKQIKDTLDAAISSRSTYAGTDTAGTTTLLSRLTAPRATNLDNLDAAVSSRSTFAGGAVASVTGSVGSVVGLTASDVGAIKTRTDNLPTDPADESLIEAAIAAIPDAFLARNAKGGSVGPSAQSVAAALAGGFMKMSIVAGVLTVQYSDGTIAFTRTLTRAQLDAITVAT